MTIARFPVLLTAAGAVALAGCGDPAQTGDSRAKQGAVLGGLLGAAAGLSSDDDRTAKTVIGAGVGAAAGAAIGNRLDKQARDLRGDFANDRIDVRNTGSELVVTMPQDILFPTDSAVVRADLRGDLGVLASNLQDYRDTDVDIVGHTDSTGSADYNQRLSTRRAQSVASILRANGVAGSRIRAIGRGQDEPVASNATAAGRQQNRRVEIVIRPRQA